MNTVVPEISWLDIGITLIPLCLVIGIMFAWSMKGWTAIYSTARMLIQLILIGYLLVFIFECVRHGNIFNIRLFIEAGKQSQH